MLTTTNLNQYQAWVRTTESGKVAAMDHEMRLLYFALGLAGEAGEAADKIKKLVRDNDGVVQDWAQFKAIQKELGDVLWYLAQLCNSISVKAPGDMTLDGLFAVNQEKLNARIEAGTINGEGDDR